MAMYNVNINCWILLGLVYLFVRYAETQCSTNLFGQGCEFVCHCNNKEQCNRTTGECPTACDFDWTGHACQRKNVVPAGSNDENEMVIRHSSNTKPLKQGHLAVDRDLSTCSSTNYANQSTEIPQWRVWLNSIHKIKHISILTDSKYLDYYKQFEVFVENNTLKYANFDAYSDQQQCYQHNDSVPTSIFMEVKCNKALYGNQLRITLATKETQLVLCDVRIYGECDDDTYGVNCTEKCSSHCDGICDKDNGTCAKCLKGWTGSSCAETCEDGKYGDNCASNCSFFCLNNSTCNHTDGHCLLGCSPGYMKEKCDEKCSPGTYGNDCKHNCSKACFQKESDYCSHVNGICEYGCGAGSKGRHCNETCSSNEWGMNCNQSCGSCSQGERCDMRNGFCANGCLPGYKTTNTCNEVCSSGTYGAGCKQNCSEHCFQEDSDYCSHVNGSCVYGCKAGFKGAHCYECKKSSIRLP